MGLKTKKQYPPLTENEKKLQEKAATGTLEEVKALLKEPDVKVDCLDECGMTPLQQAAFRNKYEIAELLLSHGADVNSNEHENDYSALMFAALSGNTEMTRLMLRHGAKKDKINSVKRNAAQMAAFVGQHQCVAVINNYYDKSDLEYFTQCHGQEKEPKLPPMLLPAVLTLLNSTNIHPVKVSYHLMKHEELLKESYKVCKVLDIICERAMKSKDTDDIMAMKAHYFATVIRKAKDAGSMDKWLKWLVRGREQDGYPECQDQLIRQALKEFPYPESQLLQNMVRQLSKTKIGDSPSSFNILMQGVNGQKFSFDEDTECTTCGEMKAKKCAKCKMVCYCDQRCQKLHWSTHKKFCTSLAEAYKKLQKQAEKEKEEEEEKQANENSQVESLDNLNMTDQEPTNENEGKQTVDEDKQASSEEKQICSVSLFKGSTTDKKDGDKIAEDEEEIPDIKELLSDPALRSALKDKDVKKALAEIKEDPLSITKYADSDKLREIIENVTKKLVPSTQTESSPTQEQSATPQVQS